MATHSSTLAWKIPWTEEPGRLQSMGGHKESDMTEQLHFLSFLKEVLLMSSFSFSLIYSFLSFSIQQRSSTYEHFLLYYKKKKKSLLSGIQGPLGSTFSQLTFYNQRQLFRIQVGC